MELTSRPATAPAVTPDADTRPHGARASTGEAGGGRCRGPRGVGVAAGPTLTALRRAVDELAVPADGEELVELVRLHDRLSARLSEAVAAFDAAGGWQAEGATSMKAWLADRGGLAHRRASAVTDTARSLARLPVTAVAWRTGALSGGQVEAIVANVSSATVERFADHETELVPTLAELPAADVATAMRLWRERATADDEPATERARSLHLSRSLAGRWCCDGSFDAETGELTATALRVAETRDAEGEPARTPGERRADAWADICRSFLTHRRGATGSRHRPHLTVITPLAALTSDPASHAHLGAAHTTGHAAATPGAGTATGASAGTATATADTATRASAGTGTATTAGAATATGARASAGTGTATRARTGTATGAGTGTEAGADGIGAGDATSGRGHDPRRAGHRSNAGADGLTAAETPSGTILPARTGNRIACDCTLHRLLVDEQRGILDYGRVTRTVPAPLWNALVTRDRHCRFPGCDRAATWCEAHHVVPWQQGGATGLPNLVLLCSRHHHLVHEPRWHAALHPNGTLTTTDPHDRQRTTTPPLAQPCRPPPLTRSG